MSDNSGFTAPSSTMDTNGLFSGKNGIIIVLVILLLLSFVGVNLLIVSGNIMQTLSNIFGPVVTNLLATLGFSTGSLINTSSDVVSKTAKFGIDVADGTVKSVGNLLMSASEPGLNETQKRELSNVLKPTTSNNNSGSPMPAQSTDSTVSSIASQKQGGWCYIGDYENARGCVKMSEHSKCMSGQVFSSQANCLNPNIPPQRM